MKQLTFILLAAVLLFGLAVTSWGQVVTPTPGLPSASPPPPTLTPTPTVNCLFSAEGWVIEQTTGKSIANATVRADTSITTTAANGTYRISHLQMNCEQLYVEVSAPGYITDRKYSSTPPGGGVMNFTLTPVSEPIITPTPTYNGYSLFTAEGYVRDLLTGSPIANAAIRADTTLTTTDNQGFYRVSQLQPNNEPLYVEVSAPGYVTEKKYTGATPGLWSIDFTLSSVNIIIPGDVNSDKKVTIIDAMLVAQYSANAGPAGFELRAGDVNNSGTVTITDALIIAQYTAGLYSNLISVQPTTGLPGDQITITGIGFDPANNEIRFILNQSSILYYSSVMANSSDGFRLTFRIPTYVHPYCYYDPMPCAAPDKLVMGGQYQITVTNSKGISYALPFIVNPI